MTPERWREVQKIFAEALEKQPSERAGYLASVCADASLREQLELMIAAHEEGDSGFLEPLVEGSNEELKSGTNIGPYEIVALIGAGGMGEVYKARDKKLGRDVAIKVLPSAFVNDPNRLSRFQREARLLASLNHPNIASIYGLEDSGNVHALVMELVEGPTLADRIRQGPIPTEEALPIAKQICEALEYAHEHGVVHRDLKPANIEVAADDTVKVLDFGLAKALGGDTGSADAANSPTISQMATKAGLLLGTAAYMAPEQAKGRPVDRRADTWAFGCVLYEMLTAKKAFGGETVAETLAAVLQNEPDWTQLPSAAPSHVRVLLRRCLQKNLRQRLQAIGDARIALEEVVSGSPGAGVPVTAAPKWRRTMSWAVGLLALAITGVAVWILKPARQSPRPEPVRFQVSLPAQEGVEEDGTFSLSPDGRQLAFVAARSDGVEGIWIRSLDSLQARLLAGAQAADIDSLFWSPDSRFLAFRSSQVGATGGRGKLQRIAAAGGPPETLCDLRWFCLGGTWSPEGSIIFGSLGGLMQVSVGGGPVRQVTVAANGESYQYPQFLPDGRHFIYLLERAGEKSGIYLGSLDVGPENQGSKRLLDADSAAVYVPSLDSSAGYLLFDRGQTLMAQAFDPDRAKLRGDPVVLAEGLQDNFGGRSSTFSASANGVVAYMSAGEKLPLYRLSWFDRTGRVQGTEGEPSPDNSVALSPDGNRALASDPSFRDAGLWLIDFLKGTSARFTFPTSPAGDQVGNAVWSPDGSRAIFVSNRDGDFSSLYEKFVSGASDEVLVLKSAEIKHPRCWSPDGRFLLYDRFDPSSGKSGIWALPLEGDKKPISVLQSEFDQGSPQLSPDGRWMAYSSDESGQPEIYVREFLSDASGESFTVAGKWQISSGGGVDPRWRGDGKELYYRAPDGKVMAVEVATSPTFQAGTPKELFQGPPLLFTLGASMPSQWGVTADGKRFLFEVPVASTAQTSLTVVLNWQAGLKK